MANWDNHFDYGKGSDLLSNLLSPTHDKFYSAIFSPQQKGERGFLEEIMEKAQMDRALKRCVEIWKDEMNFVSTLGEVAFRGCFDALGGTSELKLSSEEIERRIYLLNTISPASDEWDSIVRDVNMYIPHREYFEKKIIKTSYFQYLDIAERFFDVVRNHFLWILRSDSSDKAGDLQRFFPHELLPDAKAFSDLEELTIGVIDNVGGELCYDLLETSKLLFTLDLKHTKNFLSIAGKLSGLEGGEIRKITDYIAKCRELVEFTGRAEFDCVLFYGKDLLGEPLEKDEEERFNRIECLIDEAKIQQETLRQHFLDQFSTIDSGIIDLSGRSDLWYHTPNQSWGFSEVVSIETIERSFAPTFRQTIEYLLSDCLERRISIIDLGCGNGVKAGLFTKELEAMNPTLYLADANDEVILLARRNAKKFFSGIPRAIRFDLSEPCDRPFSKIDGRRIFLFLGQTLGNFDNPRQIMQNISDGLKPGDYLVLEVDLGKDVSHYKNGESFLRGYMRLIGFSDNDLDYHIDDTPSGISMHFTTRTLTDVKTTLYQKFIPEGTKIMVGFSAKFTPQTIFELISETGLEKKIAYQPEGLTKLVAISQKG